MTLDPSTDSVAKKIKMYESLSSQDSGELFPAIGYSNRRRSTSSTSNGSGSTLSSSPGVNMNNESLAELERMRGAMYASQNKKSSETSVRKSGFLIKRPRSMGRDWNQKSAFRKNKRRWFVLKESILSYYKNYDSDTPIDTIHIDRNTVIMASTTNPKALDVITLQGKILSMAALETEEKLEWIEALLETVRRA